MAGEIRGIVSHRIALPSLFNIYRNDQPTFPCPRSFIYADDLVWTIQGKAFESRGSQTLFPSPLTCPGASPVQNGSASASSSPVQADIWE